MNGGGMIQKDGPGIARIGDAGTIQRRWIRIKRGFHKKEVVV
jgi:hypothetical protein